MNVCMFLTLAGTLICQSALAATAEGAPDSPAARWFYTVAPILFLTVFVYACWSWLARRVRRLIHLREERVHREQQHALRVEEKLDRIISLLDSKNTK